MDTGIFVKQKMYAAALDDVGISFMDINPVCLTYTLSVVN